MKQVESFFWGIIAALGALIMELVFFIFFSTSNQFADATFSQLFLVPQFIIVGAGIEELFKYIIISRRIEMFSMERSYLVNSFLVGLGFFSVELVMMMASGALPQMSILAEIGMIHIGTAGIIGYIVATKNPKKISTLVKALIFTTTLHSAYNLMISDRTFILNYAIFLLLGIIILVNIINLIRINKGT